jgi:endo-1,4-beta-D-glucanase Y
MGKYTAYPLHAHETEWKKDEAKKISQKKGKKIIASIFVVFRGGGGGKFLWHKDLSSVNFAKPNNRRVATLIFLYL